MSIKTKLSDRLENTKIAKRFVTDLRYRTVFSAWVGLLFNLLYALYNGVLGIAGSSLWFITMCAYYTVLGTMRFFAVLSERKSGSGASLDTEYLAMKISGALLIVLSFVLSGVIYISISQNIAMKYGEIIMITIAAYTFCKIGAAVTKAVKQRKNPSPLLAVIRNIGYAEVAASVLTLQRSMLVSFGEMTTEKACVMNILSGAAVCLFVLALGISMIIKVRKKGENYG